MGGFAIVTYKGVVFDTDCGEAIFGVSAAIGAGGVAWLTGEVFDGCFGGCWHGGVVLFYVVCVSVAVLLERRSCGRGSALDDVSRRLQ